MIEPDGPWISSAYTVVMDNGTERTVYAVDSHEAMAKMRKWLDRGEYKNVRIVRAFKFEDND